MVETVVHGKALVQEGTHHSVPSDYLHEEWGSDRGQISQFPLFFFQEKQKNAIF